jgi:hypothetical protein
MHTDLTLHNVDFKIIMYGEFHEIKAPSFLHTVIQTLTKFAVGQSGSCPDVLVWMHTDLPLHNVDFKIIMYRAFHEIKAPSFLLTAIQTLTKFPVGQSGSCPDPLAWIHTDLPLHNVDFKIIMYGAFPEIKVPFLLTLIQTLTKFVVGQSGSYPDVLVWIHTDFPLRNVDFKIIMYGGFH